MARTTITPRQVMDGELPRRAAGVRWAPTETECPEWGVETECREHLTHPEWGVEPDAEDKIGEIIWNADEVHCHICADAARGGDLVTTITPRQVMDGELPWRAAGVRWTPTETECREHLTHPSWWVEPHAEDKIGEIIWDPEAVRCHLCADAAPVAETAGGFALTHIGALLAEPEEEDEEQF